MKKLLLASAALLVTSVAAEAQCLGVSGVNSVPQVGVNCQMEYTVPTYSAVTSVFAPGTAPTDISCLAGSATKVVRIKRVALIGNAAASLNMNAYLFFRSALDTVGTGGTIITQSVDSQNPTATASPSTWTSNPTINAAGGMVAATEWFIPTTASSAVAPTNVLYGDQGGVAVQPYVLRGVTQAYCVNLNGVTTPTTGLVAVQWTWTEQSQ